MENIDFNKINIKEKSKELDKLIEKAKENAIDFWELVSFIDERELYLSGKSNFQEEKDFNESHKEIIKKIEDSVIRVKTLTEYKMLLDKTMENKKERQYNLAHENAHANKAQALGAVFYSYGLQAVRYGDKILFLDGNVFLKIPDEWDSDKKRKVLMEIVKAPEEYGNEMGTSDKLIYEKLKRENLQE